jgi:hypothetical protein
MRCLPVLALLCCACATTPSSRELAPFEDSASGRWGYRDPKGAVVLAPRYQVAQPFSAQGLAAVADESGWQIIDPSGNVLLRPFVVDNGPDPFSEGLARFVDAGKVGFYDERGQIAIPARFDYAGPFACQRAAFCQGCQRQSSDGGEHSFYAGGSWGFIDHQGQAAIAAQYDEVQPFVECKARVRSGQSWQRVDVNGKANGESSAPGD